MTDQNQSEAEHESTFISWEPTTVSEEELKKHWRIFCTRKRSQKTTVTYYCAYGRRDCPAGIKQDTFHDGTVVTYTNGLDHDNHNKSSWGLTEEQKEFVLKAPVCRPDAILRLFKLEGLEPPNKGKLKNFLQRQKRSGRINVASSRKRKTSSKIEVSDAESSHTPFANDTAEDDDFENDHDEEATPVPVKKCQPSFSINANDVVNLRWESQMDHLRKSLQNVYRDVVEAQSQSITDVTLVSSEGDVMHAHEFLLSLCSPYFKRLFEKVQESKRAVGNTVIILGNVNTSHLKNLLQFVYTGEVNVPSKDAEELRVLGEHFEIHGLTSARSHRSHVKATTSTPTPLISDTTKSKSYNFRTRARKSEENSCREGSGEESERGDFDLFRTPVSEDEGGIFSETEVKVERSQSPVAENDNDHNSDYSDYDPHKDSDRDSSDDNERKTKKPRGNGAGNVGKHVITLKVQKSSESSQAEKPTSEPMVNPRTGVLETEEDRKKKFAPTNWKQIDPVPDEELKRNWGTSATRKQKSCIYTKYYCSRSFRYQCPVQLKMEIFCGRKIFYTNGLEHANHRTTPFGLTDEQKTFIDNIVKENIQTPLDILKAMKLDGNLELPSRLQIRNYLQRKRKAVVSTLRKKRKRGRPLKIESFDNSPTRRTTRNQPCGSSTTSQNPDAPTPSVSSESMPMGIYPPQADTNYLGVQLPLPPPLPLYHGRHQ